MGEGDRARTMFIVDRTSCVLQFINCKAGYAHSCQYSMLITAICSTCSCSPADCSLAWSVFFLLFTCLAGSFDRMSQPTGMGGNHSASCVPAFFFLLFPSLSMCPSPPHLCDTHWEQVSSSERQPALPPVEAGGMVQDRCTARGAGWWHLFDCGRGSIILSFHTSQKPCCTWTAALASLLWL